MRLTITAALAESPDLPATVHDLSETGMLLETRVPLAVGQRIQVCLPVAGVVDMTIVWDCHQFYGCQFEERVSRAGVSAALLQSDPVDEPTVACQSPHDLVWQVRDVTERIEQVGKDLDRTIGQLSSRGRKVRSQGPHRALAAEVPESPILSPVEAQVPFAPEPTHQVEQKWFEVEAEPQTVVIAALVLATLAAILLIAALLA